VFRRIVLLITIVLTFTALELYASHFSIYEIRGRVSISYASGETLTPQLHEPIEGQAAIRTFRDSSISFTGSGYHYRVHASSLVRLQDEPVLVYGKLSKSTGKDFVDLHFYYVPVPAQGRTMKVMVRSSDDDIEVKASLLTDNGNGRTLTVYPLGRGTFRALAGFDCEAPAVRYKLEIVATRDSISYTQVFYPFYLRETKFPTGRVILAPAKSNLLQPSERKRRESDRLIKVLATSSEESLWDGTFIQPLAVAEIISSFGKKRTYYIGEKRISVRHHRGIDYRAARGTPVFAPNHGIVVLTADRVTTGNTLVIDHGHGVFSLFFHLDSISVEEGARVRSGDKIAEAGSTGIVVGPHLHWGIWVDGTYVNPLDWLKRNF
jgi:murein DD-endopeptidase MepM/ murein hydrolase activator NlpD